MENKKPISIFQLIFFILISQLAGLIGSIFTRDSISTWYSSLIKPSFNPPNWLFGPVWIMLYILMGISAYLIYKEGFKKKEVRLALGIFGIQLALNTLWSVIFFGLKSPFYAFIEIILLWAAIIFTISKFYRISKPAAYLLIPYILWVSFAAVLNISIFLLN